MGNTRGNTYSKNHTSLNTCSTCSEFWNFGWHEAGMFDLASVIDYVLALTENDSLYYIGHSQGTTEYMVNSKLYHSYYQWHNLTNDSFTLNYILSFNLVRFCFLKDLNIMKRLKLGFLWHLLFI